MASCPFLFLRPRVLTRLAHQGHWSAAVPHTQVIGARYLHLHGPPSSPPPPSPFTEHLSTTFSGVFQHASTLLAAGLPRTFPLLPPEVFDWKVLCGATAALCTSLLLFDHAWHSWEWCIRGRIAAKLRSCTLPACIHPTGGVAPLLPHPHPPLELGALPTILQGPRGSGKTTLLKALARKHTAGPQKTPTLYIQLRSPTEKGSSSGHDQMLVIAHQLLPQIGYPTRRSYLSGVMHWADAYYVKDKRAFTYMEAREHCKRALTLLFEEASALSTQRIQGGMPPLEAAPILLFDDMQELVMRPSEHWREDNCELLNLLGTLLAAHGVENQLVRVGLAGTLLPQAFEASNPGTQFNFHYRCVQDPTVAATTAALTGIGYTEGEVGRMLALAGTRVRLFGAVLAAGKVCAASAATAVAAAKGVQAPPPVSEADFSHQVIEAAKLDFLSDLGSNSRHDHYAKVKLHAVWKELWEGKTPPPTHSEIKPTLDHSCPSPFATLFVDHLGVVSFQSLCHRHAWELRRAAALKTTKADT